MFIVKSAFGMIVFSAFLQIFAPLDNATSDYLLAVCFGGVLLGAGVGLYLHILSPRRRWILLKTEWIRQRPL